ncbi:methyltransferase domain-containing protein [Dactylosporangium sp. CA-092794]|uniref:SAM-dependent methyltransferase n=1 Tax=Dactylosporangium sp. CA-092794 TaxID=3239929 RepID=UPI003D8FC78A
MTRRTWRGVLRRLEAVLGAVLVNACGRAARADWAAANASPLNPWTGGCGRCHGRGMDMLRMHEIAEAGHRILNPFTEEKLMLLGEVCRLRPAQRQLDLACGKGEMLCRWADAFGIEGHGVDISEVFVPLARARAAELGVADRVTFELGEAAAAVRAMTGAATPAMTEPTPADTEATRSDIEAARAIVDAAHADIEAARADIEAAPAERRQYHQYDIASCIGATWIGGGLAGTVALMRPAVRDGGLLLLGEPYWAEDTPEEAYAALNMLGGEFATLEGTLDRIEAAGLELLEMVLADGDSWDRYVAEQWWTVSDWLRENAGSPDAPAMREYLETSRRTHLRYQRRYLGWGVFVCR